MKIQNSMEASSIKKSFLLTQKPNLMRLIDKMRKKYEPIRNDPKLKRRLKTITKSNIIKYPKYCALLVHYKGLKLSSDPEVPVQSSPLHP